jgi:hypothetical protein
MKTFADYINAARVTDTPRGDLIADTKTLINARVFPDVKTWAELYGFMCQRHACPEAIAEARKLWRSYQKSLTLEDVLS